MTTFSTPFGRYQYKRLRCFSRGRWLLPSPVRGLWWSRKLS
jgi:hypothetical protein